MYVGKQERMADDVCIVVCVCSMTDMLCWADTVTPPLLSTHHLVYAVCVCVRMIFHWYHSNGCVVEICKYSQ